MDECICGTNETAQFRLKRYRCEPSVAYDMCADAAIDRSQVCSLTHNTMFTLDYDGWCFISRPTRIHSKSEHNSIRQQRSANNVSNVSIRFRLIRKIQRMKTKRIKI